MNKRKDVESPEDRRERVRYEEIKRNPTGNLSDAYNRAQSGSLADLVSGLGWKGSGILILVIIIGFIITLFFIK